MTATFSNNPANSTRDAVRILINDTDTSAADLSDETIDWLIDSTSNVWFAAELAALTKASQLAERATSKQVGDVKLVYGDLAGAMSTKLRELARDFRKRAVRIGAAPYSGGISISDIKSVLGDTDYARPEIELGADDNPPHLVYGSYSTSEVF